MEACWRSCKPFAGGFDNGGGPRKAIESSHGFGFQFDAPVMRVPAPRKAPWGGSWKLQVSSQNSSQKWLVLGDCPQSSIAGAACITTGETEDAATIFTFYSAFDDGHQNVNVRLAVEDTVRAPMMTSDMLLYRPAMGFWDFLSVGVTSGHGLMRPTDGFQFDFAKKGDEAWKLLDVAFESNDQVLMVVPGCSLSVSFVSAGSSPVQILV